MFSYRVLRIILEGTGPRILSIIAKCSLLSWVCKKYKISKNERGKDSHRKEESDSVDNQDLTTSGSAAAYGVFGFRELTSGKGSFFTSTEYLYACIYKDPFTLQL